MSHFQQIYHTQAKQYHALVSNEDYQGNISRHLEQIRPLNEQTIVELGSGTGRLSLLIAPQAKHLLITDASAHMLAEGVSNLQKANLTNWTALLADSRQIPLKTAFADVAIAGWVFGHATDWHTANWKNHIGASLSEMMRVLRPGGTAIILETMGTGTDIPTPPNTTLAAYYDWLKQTHGFHSAAFRTDYQFQSVSEAETQIRFFFGDELANHVQEKQLTILPECTGVWWKSV